MAQANPWVQSFQKILGALKFWNLLELGNWNFYISIRVVRVIRGSNLLVKNEKSLSSVPRFNKHGELGAEKIQEVLTRFWRFGYKRPFTLKFHPHHNRS